MNYTRSCWWPVSPHLTCSEDVWLRLRSALFSREQPQPKKTPCTTHPWGYSLYPGEHSRPRVPLVSTLKLSSSLNQILLAVCSALFCSWERENIDILHEPVADSPSGEPNLKTWRNAKCILIYPWGFHTLLMNGENGANIYKVKLFKSLFFNYTFYF